MSAWCDSISMELGGGRGADYPTGRVVAFSNSIVFQVGCRPFSSRSTAPISRWHEITLTLAAQSDFASVKKRLLTAVDGVLADYRERWSDRPRRSRAPSSRRRRQLAAESALRFVATGVEAVIRYPVRPPRTRPKSTERVARAVLKSLGTGPKVQLAAEGAASIHVTTEPVGDAKS